MSVLIQPEADFIIRTQDIRAVVGLHPDTLRRMEKRGEFPAGILLTRRQRGWLASDVYSWLETRRQQSAGTTAPANQNHIFKPIQPVNGHLFCMGFFYSHIERVF